MMKKSDGKMCGSKKYAILIFTLLVIMGVTTAVLGGNLGGFDIQVEPGENYDYPYEWECNQGEDGTEWSAADGNGTDLGENAYWEYPEESWGDVWSSSGSSGDFSGNTLPPEPQMQPPAHAETYSPTASQIQTPLAAPIITATPIPTLTPILTPILTPTLIPTLTPTLIPALTQLSSPTPPIPASSSTPVPGATRSIMPSTISPAESKRLKYYNNINKSILDGGEKDAISDISIAVESSSEKEKKIRVRIDSKSQVRILSLRVNGRECGWHWEKGCLIPEAGKQKKNNKIDIIVLLGQKKVLKKFLTVDA